MENRKPWRVNEEPPEDFLALLYDEDELGSEVEESDIEIDEDLEAVVIPLPPASPRRESLEESQTPSPLPYLPFTSPLWENPSYIMHEADEATRRDRSRSPVRRQGLFESMPVVVRLYDENGVELTTDEFQDADSHQLFLPPEDTVTEGSSERGRTEGSGRRGGRRGMRGIRGRGGRGRGRGRGRRQDRVQWAVGHPITEVWLTDDDVPPELVSLVTDVVRNRERRQGERNQGDMRNVSESEDEELLDANEAFNWCPIASFQGREESFAQERIGSVRFHNSAYDAFRTFWDDGIISLIVEETNRYASKIIADGFRAEWVPTNSHEILCLFAFWMMLGIIKMPTYTSCFSLHPLLKTEIFRRIFTRKRYESLARALHFIDSDPASNDDRPNSTDSVRNTDRLHRLRPILTHLNEKFQSEYILDKEICIDESLTLWKGRLDFKQYIRSKAAKFGIKTFELCESVTGYLWSFLVYTGKQPADLDTSPTTLKSTSIVKKLIHPLLNKGYKLYMDNWYNSPLLARFLKRNGTDCVGTLRPSRRDVPAVISKVPLKRGEIIARHSGDVSLLAWQDKKRITMISTCHGASTALPTVTSRNPVRPVPFKPQVVLDYNKFMGGVDLKDQMLEPYLLERKRCTKWYMKLFKRLLNVSILNARTLLQSCTKKHHDHLAFRLELVDAILSKHLSQCPQSRRNAAANRRSLHELSIPAGAHWPAVHDSTPSQSKQNVRKRCVVCLLAGRANSRTTFCCEACKVPLCIPQCFKSYHETPN